MPTNSNDPSRNAFESDLPATEARTQAEERIEGLRLKGGLFVEAVRCTRMAMAVTDPTLRGNPIVFANDSFLKLSGYRMDEVLGQQPYFMNGPDTDPDDVARFEEALRNDQDDVVETIQYRKDGTRFAASVLLSAFKDGEGRTVHHFMSWLDVTRRNNAENRLNLLQQAQAALRGSEARQAFLLRLSDGIRESTDPLDVMRTTAELFARHVGVATAQFLLIEPDGDSYTLAAGFSDGRLPVGEQEKGRITDHGPGWAPQFKAGESVFSDDHETRPALDAEASKKFGVRSGSAVPLIRNGELVAIFSTGDPEPRQWTEEQKALQRDVAERSWAAVERARAETALSESEEKYRTLFESIDDGFCLVEVIFDAEGKPHDILHLEANAAYERQTGLKDIVGKRAREIVPDGGPWLDFYGNVALTGQPARLEAYLEPGVDRWISSYASRVGGEGSHTVAIVFNDITDRKRSEIALRESEHHTKQLLAELQHRVRNTLAVVRSIARRTAENTASPDDMLAHFQGRLDAFSRVQATLTRTADARVDLASLINDELVAHAVREGEQVRVDGPSVALEPKTAERLSLAIHELTTNAVKHGALMSDTGQLLVRWTVEAGKGGRQLLLDWTESGLAIQPANEAHEGFGMDLLRRSLPYDLGAQTRVELTPTGLHFELRMPLPDEAGQLSKPAAQKPG